MADGYLLMQLRDTLQEFVEGNEFAWQYLAGRYDLLRRALREAVVQVDTDDPVPLLEECWRLLTDERAARRLEAYCRAAYPNADVDTHRLCRHARALLATAQAAVAARQLSTHTDARERLLHWAAEAARLFGSGSQDLTLDISRDR
jgi:hypothetical protein